MGLSNSLAEKNEKKPNERGEVSKWANKEDMVFELWSTAGYSLASFFIARPTRT